jgi:hypothetical protein
VAADIHELPDRQNVLDHQPELLPVVFEDVGV